MNSYRKRLQEIYMLENQVEDLDFTITQLEEDNMMLKKEVKIWVFTGVGLGIMLSGAALALHWVLS